MTPTHHDVEGERELIEKRREIVEAIIAVIGDAYRHIGLGERIRLTDYILRRDAQLLEEVMDKVIGPDDNEEQWTTETDIGAVKDWLRAEQRQQLTALKEKYQLPTQPESNTNERR